MADRSPDTTAAERVFELIDDADTDGLRALLAADPAAAEARRADGVSAVLWAQYTSEPDSLELLLAAHPRLDAFEAAAIGATDGLRAELERDPRVAVAHSPDGYTALGLASFFGHLDAVELLLQRGARVNDASQNAMRVAPLHSALAGRQSAVAERLIAAGADVNAVQADGYTPLHEAAQNGDWEMAERLLATGADLTARLDDGATPAESARRAGQYALADRLDAAAADRQ